MQPDKDKKEIHESYTPPPPPPKPEPKPNPKAGPSTKPEKQSAPSNPKKSNE